MNNEKSHESPVILVGMPRSGSTLLTRIMNESPDLLIVNDFYFMQEVASANALNDMSENAFQQLRKFVLTKLSSRSSNSNERELVRSLLLSSETIEKVAEQTNRSRQTWFNLLVDALGTASREEGKRLWGYNTPQDYLYLETLMKTFPRAKFLFLIRHPYTMLASYKFVNQSGNDPARYHPFLQSILWATCASRFQKFKANPNVHLVTYESLLDNYPAVNKAIAEFLDIELPMLELEKLGNNSSHTSARRQISDAEKYVCNSVLWSDALDLGYEMETIKFRFVFLLQLLPITAQSLWFHLKMLARSNNMRSRLASFIFNR